MSSPQLHSKSPLSLHRRTSREDLSFTPSMLVRIPWSQKGLSQELSQSRHGQITCESTSLIFWYSLLLAGKGKQHLCPQHTRLFFICSKCSHLKPWFWLNSAFYNGAPTKIHCCLSTKLTKALCCQHSTSVPHWVPESYDKVKYHHSRHCPNTQEMTFPGPTRFIFQACLCTNFLGELKISLLIRREKRWWTLTFSPFQHKSGCADAVQLSRPISAFQGSLHLHLISC